MNPACPACAGRTKHIRLQGASCFECGGCQGHFMQGQTLNDFLNERGLPNGQRRLIEQALEAPASRRGLTCPSCHAKSFRVLRQLAIEIDVCDLCAGLYLDKGEAKAYLLQTRATSKPGEKVSEAVGDIVGSVDFLDIILHILD